MKEKKENPVTPRIIFFSQPPDYEHIFFFFLLVRVSHSRYVCCRRIIIRGWLHNNRIRRKKKWIGNRKKVWHRRGSHSQCANNIQIMVHNGESDSKSEFRPTGLNVWHKDLHMCRFYHLNWKLQIRWMCTRMQF